MKLLDHLILHFDLTHHQKIIRDISRPALTIETMRIAEKNLPVGTSKIVEVQICVWQRLADLSRWKIAVFFVSNQLLRNRKQQGLNIPRTGV